VTKFDHWMGLFHSGEYPRKSVVRQTVLYEDFFKLAVTHVNALTLTAGTKAHA
jgi:hypothetical protein